mgnify:CR=1 FL=1
MRQLARWMDECKVERNRINMEKAYVEIMALIERAEKGEAAAAGSSAEADAGGGGSADASAAMEIS